MSTTAIISKYELMMILDAKLTQEEKDAIIKEVVDTIQKSGGKVINSQVWMEKHKLAFRIKKRTEGVYYLINFESEGLSAPKIHSLLRLNERILRFTILNVE